MDVGPAAAKGYLVLVGTGTLDAERATVDEVLAELRAAGPVELVRTSSVEQVTEAVRSCGDRRLVVCGGDGSVHRVVQVLHDLGRLDTQVALVPMGTGNDLARGEDIPLDPTQAARLAATGSPGERDLLVDEDEQVTVNVVHAGPSAAAVAKASRVKSVLGRAAYDVGAFVQGLTTTGAHLRVSVDGEVVHDGDEQVIMVAVAIGSSIGGGARVAPGSRPHNGLAHVTVATATGPVARVGFAWAMRSGRHERRDDVAVARGHEVVVVDTGDAGFPTDRDGEMDGPFPSRTWRVSPCAWRLVCPRRD